VSERVDGEKMRARPAPAVLYTPRRRWPKGARQGRCRSAHDRLVEPSDATPPPPPLPPQSSTTDRAKDVGWRQRQRGPRGKKRRPLARKEGGAGPRRRGPRWLGVVQRAGASRRFRLGRDGQQTAGAAAAAAAAWQEMACEQVRAEIAEGARSTCGRWSSVRSGCLARS
jgi:hypothetical protein